MPKFYYYDGPTCLQSGFPRRRIGVVRPRSGGCCDLRGPFAPEQRTQWGGCGFPTSVSLWVPFAEFRARLSGFYRVSLELQRRVFSHVSVLPWPRGRRGLVASTAVFCLSRSGAIHRGSPTTPSGVPIVAVQTTVVLAERHRSTWTRRERLLSASTLTTPPCLLFCYPVRSRPQ
jgi:hypothetical protein